MASTSYTLNFDGYWRAPNVCGLPANSGIYCVHACTLNRQENTVSLRKLIYIGEAANGRDRVLRPRAVGIPQASSAARRPARL
jgi:hypothetical protein